MVVVMRKSAKENDVARVLAKIESLGMTSHLSKGKIRTIVGVVGENRGVEPSVFECLEGVERVVPLLGPFKLASRDFKAEDTVFSIDGCQIGSKKIVVIAGPCAVESKEQIVETALAVKKAGATALRGGAFKPRTSPYSFQGLGEEGLKLLALARDMAGLAVVTEVMTPEQVPLVAQYADVLQVGARNMQNFALLNAVGESHKPVLLKRGLMSTIEEFLNAAEYILSHNNPRVILCERGYTHLRDVHPQYARHQCHSRAEVSEPSSGYRGSEPCHRKTRIRGGSQPRCHSGRSRRIDRRSAS